MLFWFGSSYNDIYIYNIGQNGGNKMKGKIILGLGLFNIFSCL